MRRVGRFVQSRGVYFSQLSVSAVWRDQDEGILAHFGIVIKRLNNRETQPETGTGKATIVVEGNGTGTPFSPNERVVAQREAEIEAASAGKTNERNAPIVVARERILASTTCLV